MNDVLPKSVSINTVESEFQSLDEMERQYIIKVLETTDWQVSGEKGAAKILGLKRTTLEARMKKLDIEKK